MSFYWEYNERRKVKSLEIDAYKNVIYSIYRRVNGLISLLKENESESVDYLRYECRSFSSDLRHFLLDNGGLLNKVVLSPKLHPLGGQSFLRGDSFCRYMSLIQESTHHPREIVIDPLLGVSYDRGNRRIEILPECFLDLSTSGIPLKKWLKSKVLSIFKHDYDPSVPYVPDHYGGFCNSNRNYTYTLRDIIKFVANQEGGVHLSQKNRKDRKDMENMEIASFEVVLYAHIVIFCLSLYLLRQHAVSQVYSSSYRKFLHLPVLDGLRYQNIFVSSLSFKIVPFMGTSYGGCWAFKAGLFRVGQQLGI